MSKTDIQFHKPVLTQEVLHYLDPQPNKTYLDVTFGSGGHTRAILEKEPQCKVIALDWDTKALEIYGQPLKQEFGDRLTLLWGNFALLYKILKKERIKSVDGILADFGTSQIQIFTRPGFSVYRDSQLDMRMSPAHQKITAEEVINQADEKTLATIFKELGEERYSRRIAWAITQERKKKRISRTLHLAKIIEKIVPYNPRLKIHPATRVFQALRIYINEELNNINAFLSGVVKLLSADGRLVCISFHSLEDRIVKNFFKKAQQEEILNILTPKVVTASEEELRENSASRSARLRAAQVMKKC